MKYDLSTLRRNPHIKPRETTEYIELGVKRAIIELGNKRGIDYKIMTEEILRDYLSKNNI